MPKSTADCDLQSCRRYPRSADAIPSMRAATATAEGRASPSRCSGVRRHGSTVSVTPGLRVPASITCLHDQLCEHRSLAPAVLLSHQDRTQRCFGRVRPHERSRLFQHGKTCVELMQASISGGSQVLGRCCCALRLRGQPGRAVEQSDCPQRPITTGIPVCVL